MLDFNLNCIFVDEAGNSMRREYGWSAGGGKASLTSLTRGLTVSFLSAISPQGLYRVKD